MSKLTAHSRLAITRESKRSVAGASAFRDSVGDHVCIQRSAYASDVLPGATSLVRDVMNSPGQPLDSATRARMEPRFGYDFSGVRVHADQKAAESADALSAKAYTVGAHVAFGADRYSPTLASGRDLIAHELTHVVQQARGHVEGKPIGQGFYLSRPEDRLERHATANQTGFDEGDGEATADDENAAAPIHRPLSETYIQRDSLGLSTGQADTTKGANQAAALSAWSALGGVLVGLGSLTAAIVGLGYAKRQAAAAEDPPVAEPTTGGVSSDHTELPEVKGIDPADLVDRDVTSDEEEEEQIVISGLKGDKPIPQSEKTALSKELKTRTYRKKTVHKTAEKADQEKSYIVLRLQQGAENQADFILTLRFNGTDVRGGMTEDGEIKGYLGGSAESNAAVKFKASPSVPIMKGGKDPAPGSVRLLFGGTNVPPRKEHSGSDTKKDYRVQRFSAAAKFSGAGDFKGFDTLFATPRERSIVRQGAGDKEPLVTIALADSDVTATSRPEPISPAAPRQAAPPPPPKP